MKFTLTTGPGKPAEIFTGPGVMRELNTWLRNQSTETDVIFILTDDNSRAFCLDRLRSDVPELTEAVVLEIPSGEKNKSIKSAAYLWKELASHGASRRSLLINLGGGLITDLGGFVASTFNRGTPFIHVPTSLLAMVDAAVGGKTGINISNLKNQVGTFQNPEAIFIHTGFLGTLDSYGLLSGFAEIIKTALIADAGLWERISSTRLKDLVERRDDDTAWNDLVTSAVKIKCRIVEQDFREQHLREILNFGHTLGHAFESLSLKKKSGHLSHGHAIALGMICECYLSEKKTGLDTRTRDAIIEVLLRDYEYYPIQDKDVDFMIDFVGHDKKRKSSGICFSLLKSPGNAIPGIPCSPEEIKESIDFYRSLER